jgi:hypothetical protein
MRRWLVAVASIGLLLLTAALVAYIHSAPVDAQPEKEKVPEKEPKEKTTEECKSFFEKSLHFTGEGMRYWYEQEGGFMQVTGIPYKDLDCKNCHANSCDECHADKKDGKCLFTLEKTKKNETCLQCHTRARTAMKFDADAGIQDVHFANGMVCSDCHKGIDVHGDGKSYNSMRAPDAVKISCVSGDCHKDLDKEIRPHSAHKKAKIDCAACHAASTITCVNCHFDNFLKVKKRVPGVNFFPGKSWTLLVNHEGRVTTGNAQTLVSKGKKFVVYAPYFTHSIVKEGRKCADCHASEAVMKITTGEPVEMARFENGKLTHYKGVVPFVPDLIQWPWLDKDKDDTWVELKSEEKPIVQKAAYAEPLTEDQIKRLKAPFKK